MLRVVIHMYCGLPAKYARIAPVTAEGAENETTYRYGDDRP